jgi:hypothetical protein
MYFSVDMTPMIEEGPTRQRRVTAAARKSA